MRHKDSFYCIVITLYCINVHFLSTLWAFQFRASFFLKCFFFAWKKPLLLLTTFAFLTCNDVVKNKQVHFSDQMSETMSRLEGGSYEILYYKKNTNAIWLQVDVTPIRNDQRLVVLFLATFRDITAFKEPLDGEQVIQKLYKDALKVLCHFDWL